MLNIANLQGNVKVSPHTSQSDHIISYHQGGDGERGVLSDMEQD